MCPLLHILIATYHNFFAWDLVCQVHFGRNHPVVVGRVRSDLDLYFQDHLDHDYHVRNHGQKLHFLCYFLVGHHHGLVSLQVAEVEYPLFVAADVLNLRFRKVK